MCVCVLGFFFFFFFFNAERCYNTNRARVQRYSPVLVLIGGGGGGGGGGTERQKCQGHITSHANLNKSCRVFVKRARDN